MDIDDAKLAVAKKEGAGATLNSREPDAAKKLQQIAGGPLYGAVDLVGAADTANLALGALRKGGKLIVVGLYGGEIPVSLVLVVQRAGEARFQRGPRCRMNEDALARARQIKPIPIENSLSEVLRTLDQLKAGRHWARGSPGIQ